MNGLAFELDWNNETKNNVIPFIPKKEREEIDYEILEIRRIRAKYSKIKIRGRCGCLKK